MPTLRIQRHTVDPTAAKGRSVVLEIVADANDPDGPRVAQGAVASAADIKVLSPAGVRRDEDAASRPPPV